jgi:hypothetical protein
VSVTTLRNYERGATIPVTNNLAAIRAALEEAGIEFTDGEAPGVRLHPMQFNTAADVQALARKHAPQALDVLRSIAVDESAPESDRRRARKSLEKWESTLKRIEDLK